MLLKLYTKIIVYLGELDAIRDVIHVVELLEGGMPTIDEFDCPLLSVAYGRFRVGNGCKDGGNGEPDNTVQLGDEATQGGEEARVTASKFNNLRDEAALLLFEFALDLKST